MKEPTKNAGFPSCISLDIEFNLHSVYYLTADKWLAEQDEQGCAPEWETPEDRTRAIQEDSIWTCTWYPITPIGSYYVAASSFDRLMAFVNRESAERTETT